MDFVRDNPGEPVPEETSTHEDMKGNAKCGNLGVLGVRG